ncbi:MAG: GntR family transcriptional regulator [Rhizobiales bacterium]|nr:GntR family transcriptional regulator [Hyphomicrobiales bacterium]
MGKTARTSVSGERPVPASRVPRYLEVASVLRQRIKDGSWSVGDKISTLEELEKEIGVARVTVRQAIELLQNEGILKAFQGRGTFVTRAIVDDRWLQLATDWESLIAPIKNNVLQVIEQRPSGPPVRMDDDGEHAESYVYIRSVQSRGQESYGFARVHIAKHIHDRAPQLFSSRAALAVIAGMKGLKLSRAHQTFVVRGADVEAARYLNVPLNAPTAEARCVVEDEDGVLIYVGEITYRGDCVRLNVELLSADRAQDR